MSTFFFFLLASVRTFSVPLMLVSMVLTGLSTMSRTPTAAARWTTMSHRSMHSASTGTFITVSMT